MSLIRVVQVGLWCPKSMTKNKNSINIMDKDEIMHINGTPTSPKTELSLTRIVQVSQGIMVELQRAMTKNEDHIWIRPRTSLVLKSVIPNIIKE